MLGQLTTYDLRLTTFLKLVLLLVVGCLSSVSIAHAQSVDILWQGETYVPPFYKGLPLWSSESRMTMLAVPQGLGNSANLSYKWSKNGTVLGNVSGVGRNSLTFVGSVVNRPQNVTVQIVSSGGETLAESTVLLIPRTPELLVYENNPLYGYMFHREVGTNYRIEEAEITFDTLPLFFSSLSNTTYTWQVNNGTAGSGPSATYRVPEGGAGTANISIDAKDGEKILQSASRKFRVEFGNNE